MRMPAEFRKVMDLFGLSYDDFIRTTEERHIHQVQTAVKQLLDSGDVYLGEFEGWYDEGQEEYHTETKAKELDYKSPISQQPLVRATQTNYFFRSERLPGASGEALCRERPGFVKPEARRNEVLGRLRGGLQDVPITRTNFEWGIPFPGDEEHVIYVWIDALMNYATGVGMCESPQGERARSTGPPTYHVIGKEILWFHAVIWPAVLMASGTRTTRLHLRTLLLDQRRPEDVEVPGQLHRSGTAAELHGHLRAGRTAILPGDPGTGGCHRFRLLDEVTFHETYTTDLVNTIGNCASRTSAMIGQVLRRLNARRIQARLRSAGCRVADVHQGAGWMRSLEAMERLRSCEVRSPKR